MTKRTALIKSIKKAARKHGLLFEQASRKGANHEIWKLDGVTIPIPRHREIADKTTQLIYKETESKLGKEWWK